MARTPAGRPQTQGRTQPGPTYAPIQLWISKIIKCRERASVFCKKYKSESYKPLTHKEKASDEPRSLRTQQEAINNLITRITHGI